MEVVGTITLLLLVAMPNSDRNSAAEGLFRVVFGLTALAAIWG